MGFFLFVWVFLKKCSCVCLKCLSDNCGVELNDIFT